MRKHSANSPENLNFWSQIPFLRILLPFLAGIIIAIYSGTQIKVFDYALLMLFALIVLHIIFKKLNYHYYISWIFGILVSAFLFISGFQLTTLNTEKYNSSHFSNYSNKENLYLVKTTETILEKEKSYKISIQVLAIKLNGIWVKTSGKAISYFQKDSLVQTINYGDYLIVKTNFSEINPPQNPSEFNYKQYLSFHNIYEQAYLPSGKWASLKQNEGNKIIATSLAIRKSLLAIYKNNNITGDEFAVGSALVLGYKDKLDQDLVSAYASSGAIHVLAVSGLHVGIIYLIFCQLLFFLDVFKNGKIIKMFLLLILLWGYAILTGLSPSVLRSATMFSFIVIAQPWKHHTNIFNTLAVSCFVLLLYNPYLIMEVGFQLSYLAVLGIVSIQPWLYEKWQPKYWFINKIWQITTVSIAAQIMTFPLGILYFHQFPNYFLFSNLVVIPLATAILSYGIAMFVLGSIPSIGLACGKVFTLLVWLLNKSVLFIDQIPGAILAGITTTIFQTWLIYTLLVFIMLYIYFKKAKYLFAFLSTLILLLSNLSALAYQAQKQNSLVIYNVSKVAAYDFIYGNQTLFLADSALTNNKSKMLFHIKHNWWERKITKQEICKSENINAFYNAYTAIKNDFIQFNGKRIFVIKKPMPNYKNAFKKLRVDYIIVSKNAKVKIQEIKNNFEFEKIIFDSSSASWKIENWKNECNELNISYYSVPESGAYIENFGLLQD